MLLICGAACTVLSEDQTSTSLNNVKPNLKDTFSIETVFQNFKSQLSDQVIRLFTKASRFIKAKVKFVLSLH